MSDVNGLDTAILRTVVYADVFNFPMTVREIHHFLIHDQPVSLEQIEAALATSERLKQTLYRVNGYISLAGRDTLIPVREGREQAARRLWPRAVRYGRWLARLPFVRMVALTGALAMRNPANGEDDLDYLLITAPHRVWTARAFSILLVRLARLWGAEICPNYVLAETTLEQDRRDLFMAHEVTQMVPLYGHLLYERLRSANAWVRDLLPNTEAAFYAEADRPSGPLWRSFKRLLEGLLGGRLGDRLERWERERKLRRFQRDVQTPHSAAKLDQNRVKGHFVDHGYPTLVKYHQSLRAYGLEAENGTES